MPLADLTGGPLQFGSVAQNARTIEAIGFESIWVFDAVGRGFVLHDPLMALAVASSATTTIELGTGIMQLPIRNVVDVAHRALSLAQLAGDRFLFGVGPGSTAADFELFGTNFADRFATFDAQYEQLVELMSTGSGPSGALSPWPGVAGSVSMALAGWRGRWVERAATEASAWIASAANADDETLAAAIKRYRAAGGTRAVVTNVQVGLDIAPAVARIGRLASMGFDDVVAFDLTPTTERLTALRAEVTP